MKFGEIFERLNSFKEGRIKRMKEYDKIDFLLESYVENHLNLSSALDSASNFDDYVELIHLHDKFLSERKRIKKEIIELSNIGEYSNYTPGFPGL